MKVHLIKRQTIEDFSTANAGSRTSFSNWLMALRYADWKRPEDIQKTFRSADLLGNGSNRVVFDIGGNNNRLICKYVFGDTPIHLFVCWIGKHADYDKLCSKNEQYTINKY